MALTRIYLLHGLGGSQNGSVKKLLEALKPLIRGYCCITRPQLPHEDCDRPAEDSVAYLDGLGIPFGSLLVGISLGGLVAAKLQEDTRPDLHVIAISSPTWGCGVLLQRKMDNRLAVYSSLDEVIEGRTEKWPILAVAHNLQWLTHDTDAHVHEIALIVAAYFNGDDWCGVISGLLPEHATGLKH